jgi:VWFA-related protein
MRIPTAILLGVTLLAAQQTVTKPPVAKAPIVTFKSNTRLVVEAVSVTDASGKPVEGLTAKDFRITEDNLPQVISVCDFQHLNDTAPAPAAAAPAPAPTAPAAPPAVPNYAIAPESPGHAKYTDRRLVAIYFDMTSMPVSDQLRSLDSAQKFIAQQLKPADMVAIMSFEGAGVKVKQDFTADRDLLQKAIGDLIIGTGIGLGDDAAADAAAADTGSAFGQDDAEFNIFTTNRQLSALQTAVNMLGSLNEKKSLVYFASGLSLRGVDNQAQLEATTNAAIRANVSLFPVDARGLVATPPLGDATQGSPGGASMYNGSSANNVQTAIIRSQDSLYALGADTGGKALFDSNNLAQGIAQARNAIGSYYILGYYTTNPALDGKFRRVKVSLANPEFASAKLSYRVGYYTGKSFDKFTTADKERQLEDALMLGDPITDLTIDMEINYFQLNSAEYFVPIAAKIPGRELALAKAGGAERSLIDFIGEVKDQYGTTITNLRDKADMKLSDATAQQLAKVPIEFTAGFTLLPGTYTIKLLARDSETGRIGTYMKDFTIPNLVKVTDRLPISSVVLSSQRTPLTAALFNAKKDTSKDAAQAANPLVENGAQLMPSVTRVFHQTSPLYVYMQAYEHGQTKQQPLVAYVDLFQGTKKVFETPPQPLPSGMYGRAGTVPINFDLSLTKFPVGRYTIQVTVLDPAANQANTTRTEIEIVP